MLTQGFCTPPLHVLTVLRLVARAVNIDGRSYDVCVRLRGSKRSLLLVENVEDVKAPGLSEQAAAAKAGCPGHLEDEEEGVSWDPKLPLRKKGCYVYSPRRTRHGEFTFVTVLKTRMDNIPMVAMVLRILMYLCPA